MKRSIPTNHEIVHFVSDRDMDMMQIMLDAGHDIEFIQNGRNALTVAAEKEDLELIKFLVKSGANVNPAGVKATPLIISIKTENFKITNYLLENGADVNHHSGYQTPLMAAIEERSVRCFDLLIKLGADVNKALFYENGSPVASALLRSIGKGKHFVKALLEKGADQQAGLPTASPLMSAVQSDLHEYVQLLIDHGTNVNLTNELRETALVVGIREDAIKSIKLLADITDLSIVNAYGFDALAQANVRNNRETRAVIEAAALKFSVNSTVSVDRGDETSIKHKRNRI